VIGKITAGCASQPAALLFRKADMKRT